MLIRVCTFVFFLLFPLTLVFCDPIPCSTCTLSNADRCCAKHGRCCSQALTDSGVCPSFPSGKCTFRCLRDFQCRNTEKCCHRNGNFPSVCVVVTAASAACPKSMSKSLVLKSCTTDASVCSSGEVCCHDPRQSGCCLKKINSISITSSTMTSTMMTATTTRRKLIFDNETVVNE